MSQQAVSQASALCRGQVVWFNDAKGYGFIRPGGAQDDQSDVFVHFSAVAGHGRRNLQNDQLVEFEAVASPKGIMATNVRVIKPS